MRECVLCRFRTMYWSIGNGVYVGAMDGSQHHNLVNADSSIRGLTIDAKGRFYHVETSSKYSALQIYFDNLFYYLTCVMAFCGVGEMKKEFEIIRNVFLQTHDTVSSLNSQNWIILVIAILKFVHTFD